jgi:hypothetical protein
MGAAGIGIVDRIDVSWMHVALEGAHHVLASEVQRADVDRDVLVALRRRVAVCIVQRAGEVAVVDDEGIAGAQNLLGHLIDAGNEGILQHLESDGIKGGFGGHRIHSDTRMMILRYLSTEAVVPGGITTVESTCSTTAGPLSAKPAGRSARS